jgi:single-strand DNA-binding protein
MNQLTMTGHLTRDPELKHIGERAICELRLAVDNGRYPTTYIDVDTFDGQAYVCAEYLAKGRRVGASGRLALREWDGGDGRRRSATA